MCGIAAFFSETECVTILEAMKNALKRRGPDSLSLCSLDTEVGQLDLIAGVLHLRGPNTTVQPLQDEKGNILLWNGQVFDGLSVDLNENDTAVVLRNLCNSTDSKGVALVLGKIQGPFAFIYWQASTRRLYFGRDKLGRRSLLLHYGGTKGPFYLCSVLPQEEEQTTILSQKSMLFSEVSCEGFYSIQVDQMSSPQLYLYMESTYKITKEIQEEEEKDYVLDFLQVLKDSVGRRVRNIPLIERTAMEWKDVCVPARVGVLFSGGLDSVVLAALCHFHVPLEEPIDLISICFDEKGDSPDRLAALAAVEELYLAYPGRKWRLVRVDVPYEEVQVHQRHIWNLVQPCTSHMDFNIGTAFWFLSRGIGWISPQECQSKSLTSGIHVDDLNGFLLKAKKKNVHMTNSIFLNNEDQKKKKNENTNSSLGDQSLAGNPSKECKECKECECKECERGNSCPVVKCKRKLKKGCSFQICRACCFKVQRFLLDFGQENYLDENKIVEMGLDLQVLVQIQKSRNKDCTMPICAVHSSTKHHHNNNKDSNNNLTKNNIVVDRKQFKSQAKVLLVGIGADEQLAGYGRHKTAFLNGGYLALKEELKMDMNRIWKRNLGRDDRCIADHSREARFPYLDEQVVEFIQTVPIEQIVDFNCPRGIGDKMILRQVAKQLGLQTCTKLAKRAIQFGSRIARISNQSCFGSNRKASGTATFTLITQD